jgi:tetratricopeptide (TPR) repeat protein
MLSPWMLIGALSHRRRWPDEQYVAPIEPSAALLIVAVLASIVLPATFGRKFAETRTNEANTLIAERRTVEARRIVRRLADFGSSMSITIPTRRDGELPKPAEALAVLDRAVAQLNAEVARLHRLPDSASNRLAVASRLMSLDRWAEAEKMLRRLAGAHGEVQATLLLAEGYQHEHAWQQSNEQFQRIVSSSPPEEKAGWSSFEKVLVRSYKGLAYNYREQRRYDDAEAVYVEALQRLPEVPRQAEFHFLLGRHFEQGGKAHEALVHLRRAVALDPQRFQSRAAPILQEIGRQTPACFPVPMSDEQ